MTTNQRVAGRRSISARLLLTRGLATAGVAALLTAASAAEPALADDGSWVSGSQLQGGSVDQLSGDMPVQTPDGSFVTSGAQSPFDRSVSVAWAVSQATQPQDFQAACTWFVSQSLWAGGLARTDAWTDEGGHGLLWSARPGTPEATAVQPLLNYLLGAYPASQFEALDPAANAVPDAQLGDVIAYDWEGDGTWDHLALVTGFADGQYPLVSEWGSSTDHLSFHPSVPYVQRGWTWSQNTNQWLQTEYPNVRMALLHIDTTIPSTY